MKTTISTANISAVLTTTFVGTTRNAWVGETMPHNQFRVTISNENGRGWFIFTDSYNNYAKGVCELDEKAARGALACFLSDGSSYSSCIDFADFCACFGYDEDSRKAWKVWKACERSHNKAVQLFGEDYANEIEALEN